MKKTFLFYGFGAEYVLHPIYEELIKKGETCIEIDALTIKNSRSMIKKPVVLVTSAHLLLDQKSFTDYYPTDSKFYSVMEIISLINPLKSVFFPHDLTEPFIEYEDQYLNQLDLFLSPGEPFSTIYSQYVKTEEVGWIKYRSNQTPTYAKLTAKSGRAIWFLSDFILYLTMGMEKSYEVLAPILTQGVSVKLPLWQGSNEFEDYFTAKGVRMYPAVMNAVELIQQHDIILTNGLSSIIAESYYSGKTTVNITERSHYGNKMSVLKKNFPDLIFYENIVDFKLPEVPEKSRKPTLKPFDMDKAISFIIN